MKRNVVAWAALVVSTAALVSSRGVTRPVPAAPRMPAESQRTARALSDAFVSVADFVKPSVVQISVQRKLGGTSRLPGGQGRGNPFQGPQGEKDMNDLLREMMKRFNAPGGPDAVPEQEQFGGIARGTGSGFVYDDKGHVLTNNHVVNGAGKITVMFHDGVEASATVVGTDPKSDVAVIKVDNTSYTPLPVGTSGKLRVGELVMAVGSPFGLSQSVTMGIISATERNNLGINESNGIVDTYESFIQTDAPINPGNSGGPLVDMDGRVIGINSAIMTRGGSSSGGNDGVGFAIPIDMASNVADKLIKDGKVNRARIGVAIGPLTPAAARILGIDTKAKGLIVEQVVAGSPADKAGLKPGDVIVRFNHEPIASVHSFRNNVAASDIGKAYPLTYFRDGKEHSTEVVLGSSERVVFDQEKEATKEPEAKVETEKTKINDFGLEVQPLTPDLAKGLGVAGTQGVLISSVKEGSPAEAAGLAPGMVITQVAVKGKKVQDLRDVKAFESIARDSDELLLHVKSSDVRGAYITLSKAKKD